jgi:hypothetical protein
MAQVTALAEKRAEKQGFDLNSVLSGAAVSTEKKSKSSVPVLQVPDAIKELATRMKVIVEQLDNLTAEKELVGAELIEGISPIRADHIIHHGFASSVCVPNTIGTKLTLSWQHKYSKIGLENQETLSSLLGDDMDKYMTMGLEIKVKADALNEEMLKELIELVGPENFARFFEVSRWYYPTERYTQEMFTAFSEEQREGLTAVVRQFKPSIKTK